LIGARLYIRTRRWVMVIAISALAAAMIMLCGPMNYSLNPAYGYLVKVAVQIPVLPAIAIQASLASPVGQQELSGSRDLSNWRLVHMVFLTAIAALFLGLAIAPLATNVEAHSTQGVVAIVRNLLALTGAGLIGSAIFGPRLAWLVPVTWLIVPFLFVPRPTADLTGVLTLIGQDDIAFVPFVAACAVWAVGVALASKNFSIHRGED
jgi:hypothetical protein